MYQIPLYFDRPKLFFLFYLVFKFFISSPRQIKFQNFSVNLLIKNKQKKQQRTNNKNKQTTNKQQHQKKKKKKKGKTLAVPSLIILAFIYNGFVGNYKEYKNKIYFMNFIHQSLFFISLHQLYKKFYCRLRAWFVLFRSIAIKLNVQWLV